MSSSCSELRQEFINCVAESECIKSGKTFHQCVKDPALDAKCVGLKNTYFECRRGWFDMRNRMKGNISVRGHSELQEAEEQALADSGIVRSKV
uniref:Cytochrome c oxidase assembly factor 5 n=1 Tax=Arcella intermedia TaxID=1963864 RepID=A0A6B2LUI2_9EUKA